MNLWRNLINQISAGRVASARRFVAGGGADLVLSTALWRADRFIEQNSLKLLLASFLLPVYGYERFQAESRYSALDSIRKSNNAMKRAMEEEGVTRMFLNSIIAELKRKTESPSASEHERSVLQIYEEWLRMYEG